MELTEKQQAKYDELYGQVQNIMGSLVEQKDDYGECEWVFSDDDYYETLKMLTIQLVMAK